MKVICINDLDIFSQLTHGKIYEAENFTLYLFKVVNDNGVESNFYKNRFLTIDEWREKKLNELGI
jgi:hypothetical protein